MPAASSTPSPQPSAREVELVEAAYAYVLDHGLSELSLRPLAAAIGSSPRVLLFLFGSKDGLVRRLLARARQDELARLEEYAGAAPDPAERVRAVWGWLSAPEHDKLLRLWVEAYGRSLLDPSGPWGDFAGATVTDWLDVLGGAGPERTLVLAALRGAMLDLLATGDRVRTSAAIDLLVARLR